MLPSLSPANRLTQSLGDGIARSAGHIDTQALGDSAQQTTGFDVTQPADSDLARPAGFEETRPLDWEDQVMAPDYEEVIAAMASGELIGHEFSERKRVLVVDDDVTARLYLRAKLSLIEGVDVYEAASGDEALQISQHTRFDGVLLDVNMQGRDGYEVCRAIKRNSRELGPKAGKGPKIYIVTSRSGLMERVRATLAGADAFLSKPPHPSELTTLLAAL
jgi:CheY-like chemotaxis protein